MGLQEKSHIHQYHGSAWPRGQAGCKIGGGVLHTAYCILPTAYCILHTAYCILHTASSNGISAMMFRRFEGKGLATLGLSKTFTRLAPLGSENQVYAF